MKEKYKLNIQRKMVHSLINPCSPSKRIKDANAKYFENLNDAINYYEGDVKAEKCSCCKFCE